MLAQVDTNTWDAPIVSDDFNFVQSEAEMYGDKKTEEVKACTSTI
jgi:hypothetical protein